MPEVRDVGLTYLTNLKGKTTKKALAYPVGFRLRWS